jgi:NO-binding membrane sensor protein with MHYT domain/two-component sensor histidine kinase
MAGTYNGWIVLLSVVIAVVGSYVALELASRVAAPHEHRSSRYWLIGAAIAFGAGIWSMHFVGMLAYRLPIPVSYDVWITLASLLAPMLVTGLGLSLVSRDTLPRGRLLIGGMFVGAAIVIMHYTGMAAMKMAPPIRYDPVLVGLSAVIALGASIAALWSAFRFRMETIFCAIWKKVGSAILIGAGIAGTHYTGMMAARFAPDSVCTAAPQNIDNAALAVAVAAFTITFQFALLLIAAFHAYNADRLSRQSSRKLVEMQELERKQLARELHDRVGQNLTALGINLDILRARGVPGDRPDLGARLDDSIALVDATAEAIENVMSELRPPMLDDHGLLSALQWYAREFSLRAGIEVEMRGEDPKQLSNREVEIALFRIAQEALTNVAKHAGATRVVVALEQAGAGCVLSISDNGAGFATDLKATRPGQGLVTMAERAEAIGGRLDVRASAGSGTQINIFFPCG